MLCVCETQESGLSGWARSALAVAGQLQLQRSAEAWHARQPCASHATPTGTSPLRIHPLLAARMHAADADTRVTGTLTYLSRP